MVPWLVLITMVPAITAKLTGSTTGPVLVPNPIRPMPPAPISRQHSTVVSLLMAGGLAWAPNLGGTW